jgi:preprotein translocase subunit SecD
VAPPPGTLRVGRYFLALFLLLIALYSLIVFPGQRHTPKLGIDLVGGLRVVFTAITPKGAPPPTSAQMSQARQIMEDRINTYGVTGATVVVQGSDQLVIEIPSGTGADVNKIGKAAVLNFRGVMAPAQPVTCTNKAVTPPGGSSSASPSGSTSPSTGGSTSPSTGSTSPSTGASSTKGSHGLADRRLAPSPSSKPTKPTKSTTPTTSTTPSGSASPTASPTTSQGPTKCTADPFAALRASDPKLKTLLDQRSGNTGALNAESCPSPAMPSFEGQTVPCQGFADLTATQQQEILTALQSYKCSAAQGELDLTYSYYVACRQGFAYLLGHVVVHGTDISSATAQAPNPGQGQFEWTVNLALNDSGANAWHDWTSKFNTQQNGGPEQTSSTPPCGASQALPCSDWVAFTLDGAVLTDPITHAVLSVTTQISGGFTQSSANSLATELSYGKLTVSFRIEENNPVSATLGNHQLHAAFIAGGIGLALVIIYSLLYYRALGFVTIASLVVSALLTYAMLVILAKQIGFTLDLAGIAGFIVALGITADSFVVFFERIKDEVHEGRSMRVAVPRAWVRARRTILSADTVSFLAAAILYYFASADVKGFAFTLGMSTILDLVVVFLFTHPMVSVLSRSAAFGSARMSGLASVRTGGIVLDDERPAATAKPSRARRVKPRQQPAGAVAVPDEADEAEATESIEPDTQPEAPTEPDQPRRRTTPAAGSAAERAAARRARLREQGGDGKETR